MTKIKFEIDNYYDILNLYKALLEDKFYENPNNTCVYGSPIIAKIINELLDIISNYELQEKGFEKWSEWRKLKNHNYYKERAIMLINNFEEWRNLDINKKKNIVFNYISPFTCKQSEILNLIDEINLKFNKKIVDKI